MKATIKWVANFPGCLHSCDDEGDGSFIQFKQMVDWNIGYGYEWRFQVLLFMDSFKEQYIENSEVPGIMVEIQFQIIWACLWIAPSVQLSVEMKNASFYCHE